MSSTSSARAATTVPLTFAHEETTFDLAVPLHLPLAEVVPVVIDEMGLLTPQAASSGFRLRNDHGSDIPLDQTPMDAGLVAGDVVTVEPIGSGELDQRYDDLVEALASVVESDSTAWTPQHSLHTSVAAAVALWSVLAAVLWSTAGLLALTAGLGSAVLAIAAAVVLTRMQHHVSAVVVYCVGTLMAAVGVAGQFTEMGMRLVAGGGTGIVLGMLGLALLRPFAGRGKQFPELAAMAGPIYAGTMALWSGSALAFLDQTPMFAALTTIAVTGLTVLMAPWIALAQTPIRSYIPRTDEERAADTQVHFESVIRKHEAFGRVLAITLRISGGLVLLAATPFVIDGSIPALVVVGAVGVALLLSTRQQYDRNEVLIGIISGSLVLVEATLLLARAFPHLAEWVVWFIIAVAALVLALGALRRLAPPLVARWSDSLSVIALLVIVPATAIQLGFV